MWEKIRQKGAETVEYAIVLACIAGLCVMFSDNLKATMNEIMGNVGSAVTDTKDNTSEEDGNMKWLQAFKDFAEKNQDLFQKSLGNTTNSRKDGNFTNDNGLIDSGSPNSKNQFVDKINETLAKAGFENCSWSFGSYTDGDNMCYNVSIYNPNKNGNQALSDKKSGDTITTDIYTINMTNNTITKVQENATQKVAERNNNGKTYNVIRDKNYK